MKKASKPKKGNKIYTFRADVDLEPFLREKTNLSAYINGLIRKDKELHPDEPKEEVKRSLILFEHMYNE